ncbi:unnamed protein product, partial [Ectocarpus fasciculatus]
GEGGRGEGGRGEGEDSSVCERTSTVRTYRRHRSCSGGRWSTGEAGDGGPALGHFDEYTAEGFLPLPPPSKPKTIPPPPQATGSNVVGVLTGAPCRRLHRGKEFHRER